MEPEDTLMPDCTPHAPEISDLYDAELVMARLADAGRTLMALWVRGVRPAGYGSGMPEYGHDPEDLRDQIPDPEKIDPPSAREVSDMDRVLAWLKLIPDSKLHWRRVVGYRMLVNPRTGKRVMSFKTIAFRLNSGEAMCERVYYAGVDLIVRTLNEPAVLAAARGVVWRV